MRFRFRFQRILDLKEKEVERRQEAVAARLRRLHAAEARAAQCEKALAETRDWLRELQRRSPLPLLFLRDVQVTLRHLREEHERAVAECEAAARALRDAKEQLMQAYLERRRFEYLRERDAREYRYRVQKREQSVMDEIGVQNHARRSLEQPV